MASVHSIFEWSLIDRTSLGIASDILLSRIPGRRHGSQAIPGRCGRSNGHDAQTVASSSSASSRRPARASATLDAGHLDQLRVDLAAGEPPTLARQGRGDRRAAGAQAEVHDQAARRAERPDQGDRGPHVLLPGVQALVALLRAEHVLQDAVEPEPARLPVAEDQDTASTGSSPARRCGSPGTGGPRRPSTRTAAPPPGSGPGSRACSRPRWSRPGCRRA